MERPLASIYPPSPFWGASRKAIIVLTHARVLHSPLICWVAADYNQQLQFHHRYQKKQKRVTENKR
jgi:hypothetical protein